MSFNSKKMCNFAPQMNSIKVIKVVDRREMNDFVAFPNWLYKDCKQYVPDMESDVRNIFNPKKNSALEFCDVQPFIAYKDGKTVGRIIGIINHKANKQWDVKNVRFSHIEFINNIEVSKALLETVEEWGKEKGMNRMVGPMGITDYDKEGMLVEDFDLMGSVTAIYNLPYYPQHMEKLGFKKEVDWLQIRINVPQEIPARYARVAKYCREMAGLKVRKLSHRQILRKGYGQQIFSLLNEAYKPLFGFSELTPRQIDECLSQYLKAVDTKQLMPTVFNEKNEFVGVAITMASMSQAMRKSKGRLWPFGWYHLLKAMKWKHADNAEMLLIAVRPDYQGLGVNAMFFDDLIPIYNRYGFKWAETGPQLEDNVRELNQWKPLNPKTCKRRRCYSKSIIKD